MEAWNAGHIDFGRGGSISTQVKSYPEWRSGVLTSEFLRRVRAEFARMNNFRDQMQIGYRRYRKEERFNAATMEIDYYVTVQELGWRVAAGGMRSGSLSDEALEVLNERQFILNSGTGFLWSMVISEGWNFGPIDNLQGKDACGARLWSIENDFVGTIKPALGFYSPIIMAIGIHGWVEFIEFRKIE